MKRTFIGAIALAVLMMVSSGTVMAKDANAIYKSKCKMCHKFDKKKIGPAFKDMNKDPAALKATIIKGRRMMPKWGKKLTEEEIDSLVVLIQSKQG